jgi:hypothetical protein
MENALNTREGLLMFFLQYQATFAATERNEQQILLSFFENETNRAI